ncbi:MAG: MBL fold metallo-hydrolase [Candidatus Heimdallarchaeota archaeon]|nr:MAG: MBL fold metallo-hydrolase [Candidatus Heimdallarchaeota archaeon]
MVFEKVNENLYLLIDESYYDTISSALVLPNSLIMVDSGIHVSNMKEFRKYVEDETGKKFDTLILTHHHNDHVIGNQVFSDCKIIATKTVAQKLKTWKKNMTPEKLERRKETLKDKTAFDGLEITLPNETFDDYLEIIDENIKVVIKRTGGHTKGSTSVYCPSYKILIAGDNLLSNFPPYGADPSCNPDTWINTLNEYLTLDVEKFIPGHGKVSDHKLVKDTIKVIEKMRDFIKKQASKDKTKEEVIEEGFDMKFYPVNEDDSFEVSAMKYTLSNWYKFWVEEKN